MYIKACGLNSYKYSHLVIKWILSQWTKVCRDVQSVFCIHGYGWITFFLKALRLWNLNGCLEVCFFLFISSESFCKSGVTGVATLPLNWIWFVCLQNILLLQCFCFFFLKKIPLTAALTQAAQFWALSTNWSFDQSHHIFQIWLVKRLWRREV